MTRDEYFNVLIDKYIAPSPCPDYFHGHRPRFEAQVEMFEKHLAQENIAHVLDVGTGIPFVSWWFALNKNAMVITGMPGGHKADDGKVIGIDLNLNTPKAIPCLSDVVICTECLEHLPSDLYRTRRWLMGNVRPGGWLLLSFPLGGAGSHGPRDYWRDDLGDKDQTYDAHIREFTEDTAREFYRGAGWELIEEKTVFTKAYGGNIMNVLLRRPTDGL